VVIEIPARDDPIVIQGEVCRRYPDGSVMLCRLKNWGFSIRSGLSRP
jgi:hypothetical protein